MDEGRETGKMEKRKKSDKGQVAVILILVTAVALVFYAISLNFGRQSQVKTLVTIASETAAAQMASYLAGYGQSLSKTNLEGKQKLCSSTSVLAAIIGFIIIVVLVIASFGAATPLLTVGQAIFIVALAAATVVIQVQLQASLTNAWNSKTTKILSTRDQIIENAIQGALQKSVSDQKMVPDVHDLDRDRMWEPIDSIDPSNPADTIARFAVYYNERLKSAQKATTTNLQDFVDALEEFLYEDPFNTGDTWGIYDDAAFTCSSAECNPCCVPDTATYYGVIMPPMEPCADASPCPTGCTDCSSTSTEQYQPSLRPSSCSSTGNDAYWKTECAKGPYNATYPWAYQRYPEDPDNAFDSFRELLGRDDEHQLFEKNSATPNGVQIKNALTAPPLPPTPWNFLLKDTTEYYVSPPFASTTDNRKGIFPFFYKVADWGVDISPSKLNRATYPAHCYWFDNNYDPCPVSLGTLPQEIQNQPLSLPNNPATLTYNTTAYVDGFVAATGGTPPLAVDKITFPDDIVQDDNGTNGPQCAQKALAGTAAAPIGFWKRGGDQYCTNDPANEWPYSSQCPKHSSSGTGCDLGDGSMGDCSCNTGDAMGPENFPDDVLDDIIYGIPDFIDWAMNTLAQNVSDLNADFTSWYTEAALWIEPGTGVDPWGSNAVSGTDCYVCNAEDGGLVTWLKEIQMMIDRLEAWKDKTSYASTVCDEVWCVPASTCSGGGGAALVGTLGLESTTFNDPDSDGINGDIDDIIACLDWNVSDAVTTSDGLVTATGNAQKFQACYNACSDVQNNINLSVRAPHASALCNALPRSLVPGFDKTFVDLNLADVVCQSTCTSCIAACAGNAVCIAACSCGGCACSNAACLSSAITAAKGSCADTNYMTDLQQSILEAQNQVAKFNQREVFLSNRVNEVNNILNNVLIPARDQFQTFLNGPAADLIQYRINYTAEDEGLPYQAIYGWQDDPPKNNPLAEGMWHVVKVDARLPDKCDNLCGAAGGSDPGWPRINTYTKSWGTKRCYELVNTDGMVKFRTSRFDQRSTTSSLFFPNGMPVWKFRSGHPQRAQVTDSDVSTMASECSVGTIKTLPDSTPQDSDNTATTIYYDAFMLNKKLDGTAIDPACKTACLGDISCEASCPMPNNLTCWDTVHTILANGVSSEACAQYYWHSGTNQGMGFKFVDCVNF